MQRNALKLFLLMLLVLPFVLFIVYGAQEHITLETIKAQLNIAKDYYQQHPFIAIMLFALADMAVAALSIPITALMSIIAGALFDFWLALIIVSISSTIGAMVPFLISRYVARDMVQQRFPKRLSTLQRGVERDGALYLFALRLTLFLPFWVVNLLMGVTSIHAFTYFWVTFVATLPIKILYILAGQELAELKSLSDIVSPGMLLLFTGLGLFPLLARKLSEKFLTVKAVKT